MRFAGGESEEKRFLAESRAGSFSIFSKFVLILFAGESHDVHWLKSQWLQKKTADWGAAFATRTTPTSQFVTKLYKCVLNCGFYVAAPCRNLKSIEIVRFVWSQDAEICTAKFFRKSFSPLVEFENFWKMVLHRKVRRFAGVCNNIDREK